MIEFGSYQAKENTTLFSLFSMMGIGKGDIIVISEDIDNEGTLIVEYPPFCHNQILADNNWDDFEILN